MIATIPGRPPLRKLSYEAFGHERSCSAPGTNWRAGPFGDALMACVTGPSPIQQQNDFLFSPESLNVPSKPLSPILSPGASPNNNTKPSLKLETSNVAEELELELPPQVPPKSPSLERKGSPAPLVLNPKSSKPQLMTPASMTSGRVTPLSAVDRRSPNGSVALPTPPSTFTNPFYAASPSSARNSPRAEKKDPIATQLSMHNRNQSESSIMDRGRPTRRSSKRQRSRTLSEAANSESTAPSDTWTLPNGMRVPEATRRMSDADKKLLHKQAYDQAGNFEVLNKRDVASLSRVRSDPCLCVRAN